MADTPTAVAEPKPASTPHQPISPDVEARYTRRGGLLGSKRARWGIALVVLVLLVAGLFAWRYFTSYESTDDAQIDGHINSVSARVSGHVIKLNFEDNQLVQQGTVLVEIDPADYQIAVNQAQAQYDDAVAQAAAAGINIPVTNVNTSSQVASAQAGVANAKAAIAAAKQQFEAAKAQVAQAEANNVKAQDDLVRYKQLIDKQEISAQQYDQAVAAAKASAATVEAYKASADAAQAQIEQAQGKLLQANADLRNAQTAPQLVQVTRSRAQAAEATVQQRKAALDQAKLNLQYTKIVAPVTGVASNRTVEVGQNVSVGQEMLKVVPLEDLWVTANFKETQLKHMEKGQKVDIEVDANGKTYKGHVDSISGASGALFSLLPPENATGNYVKVVQRIPIKIVFEPGELKGHELRPGMSVEPKVWIK
ncbi:MAG TPA: HlyD family secretion protein [Terriglobales bacterium]|nr:HlyD family secretion protein [Terriglobales bacterium]